MKQTIDHVTLTGKVYKSNAIFLRTYLGGPLVAGYLLAENFKTLGQPEKVKQTWMIAIVVAVVVGGGIFLIPENINISESTITAAYSGAALGFCELYQEEKIRAYIKQGGPVHSRVKVIGIGILGGLVYMGAIFALILALAIF